MRYYFLLLFLFCCTFSYSQSENDFTDNLKGTTPTNYISLEGALTPGVTFSAGIDAYLDIFKAFKKEKGFSWAICGQYYAYTLPEKDEKWNYSMGHFIGTKGGGYKFGTGFILYQKTKTMRFKYYYDSRKDANSEEMTSRFYYGPCTRSYGLFVHYGSENWGNGWVKDTVNNELGSYRILSGYKQYIMPTLRIQNAWSFLKKDINEEGQKGWRYFDIGFPFTPDFKEYGVKAEWFFLAGIWTSRLGIGAIYRTEIPNDPDANRAKIMHWYFPITFTIGIGGNFIRITDGDKRFNDIKGGKSFL